MVYNAVHNYEPDHDVVIDHMLDEIWNGEHYQRYSHMYAVRKTQERFGQFNQQWFEEWVLNEEFSTEPMRTELRPEYLSRYHEMFNTYWSYKASWFYQMIADMNKRNLREAEIAIKVRHERNVDGSLRKDN